ncbi:MAG TPA: lysophospholipid acyltransferase family protein [Steroidobacteraceae bacterium]|nr:lysophospholipid acyltransferase family protein [Steroidobacteraceae bacterium]
MRNANCGSRAATSAVRSAARPGLLRAIFGIYAWLEFTLAAMFGLLVLLLTPGLARRRRFVRLLARVTLRLAGMRIRLSGLQNLTTPCILVANHCSYIDGVVLTAALPPSFSFVIKREMAGFPLAGALLRLIGSEFVERIDRKAVARDTRRLLRSAASGQAMAFFPEGTFGEEVGLLRFHIGAFAAAARARLPVVPVAIRGTRHCLPAASLWPNPGPIEVEILPLLPATAADAAADADVATRLRDSARASILAAVDEPDLASAQA